MDQDRRERQLEKIADENGKKHKEMFGMHNYDEKIAVRDRMHQEIRVLTDVDRLDDQERQDRLMKALLSIGPDAAHTVSKTAIDTAQQQFEFLHKLKQDRADFQNAQLG